MNSTSSLEEHQLAQDILQYAADGILVHLRFLDSAFFKLETQALDTGSLATNGSVLYYNPRFVIDSYSKQVTLPARNYLHSVFHCIYRHVYGGNTKERLLWDLACDVVVEASINDLGVGVTDAARARGQRELIDMLLGDMEFLTAQRVYTWLKKASLKDIQRQRYEALFSGDDHVLWYAASDEGQDETASETRDIAGITSAHVKPGQGKAGDIPGADGVQIDDKNEEAWEEIAQRMEIELKAFAGRFDTKTYGMIAGLKAIRREQVDYADFLQRFAVRGETLKVNDDEFDYIFYTYGLKLYGNLPLIEPLEYGESKRIRDFVIAIDTSGSTSGDMVESFMRKTYTILKATESFFSKVNVYIIQADAEIQDIEHIENLDELEHYVEDLQVKGLGGTDFRPVFSYVQGLIEQGDLRNFGGLLYFTDGQGTYPEYVPSFESVFVFVDDGEIDPHMPPWAMKVILDMDEL